MYRPTCMRLCHSHGCAQHIPYVTDLDCDKAVSLGQRWRVSRLPSRRSRTHTWCVNVFGERVAHLHFNIAPHRDSDALSVGPERNTRTGGTPWPTACIASLR
jgi:hypothetical protein